ncbi:unnamed protein product, partial [Mesorhabditis belari]|uniref:RRM domain-containing protein n=1 Tax=Mesorhabditis belari TaxID=2138241 RepID=A0AAF3EF63_9BILA
MEVAKQKVGSCHDGIYKQHESPSWLINTRKYGMPSLVERSPDGGYTIPQLYDDGYVTTSNKSSPNKEIHALKKCWPGSPTFVSEHDGLPMSPTLKSQYCFNAFISNQGQLKETVAPTVNHIFNDYYALLGGADNSFGPQKQSSHNEVFARKVFIGGLPIDVQEADIYNTFRHFGKLVIDWPRRSAKETIVAANARTINWLVHLITKLLATDFLDTMVLAHVIIAISNLSTWKTI